MFNGVDDNGDIIVDVYFIFDGVYDLCFNMVLCINCLFLDIDVICVFYLLVIYLVQVMVVCECGESGVQFVLELFYIVECMLVDVIFLDVFKYFEEIIFYMG